MAYVKTFRINPSFVEGVPDREIRDFLSFCEKTAIINVQMVFIPAVGTFDPRLTVVVTKLDDLHSSAKADDSEVKEV